MTWIVHMLMEHPHIQDKLHKEIDDAKLAPDANGYINSLQCADRLPYLAAVIKETLRFLPTASTTFARIVPPGGREVLGHFLPQGTECAISIYTLHHSPLLWDRPEEFLPDRWFNDSIKRDSRHFSPFLLGPRACIGKELANMVMHLVITNLVRCFRFSKPDMANKVTPCATPIMKPAKNHLYAHIHPRIGKGFSNI
ncbi:hypothetical protein DSO57_1028581 [Entomophthora muscae]|nr:hypothetical protein DSO57_1028581 [Entomophthora muscae]